MKFRVGDIQPNPFRHMDRYPIRREKVAALRESLRTTGYWDNVVGRVTPDGPQIAYGHHRLTALREEYSSEYEVELIIRELSDDQMLKIMARENMEEWGTSAAVEQETVRAVVEAFAEDRIQLSPPGEKVKISLLRSAPSFTPLGDDLGAHPSHAYTAQSVADFLGWLEPSGLPQQKLRDALAALQFIEEGILTESDFDGLSTTQAKAVMEQARRVRAERETRARLRHKQAEEAEQVARAAEARRQQAEREQRQLEERAAVTRKEEQRRVEERAARLAQERAQTAQREQMEAEARQQAALRQELAERERGRQQASDVGKHVSKRLKEGYGSRQAAEIAAQKRDDIPPDPRDIDNATFALARSLNKLFDPEQDPRAAELDKLLDLEKYISEAALRDLAIVLRRVVERTQGYQNRLAPQGPIPVHAEVEIVDAVIVD